MTRGLAILLACAACGAPPFAPAVDAELDAATSAATDAFEGGRLADAVQLYERALARARAMDDPSEIGNAAYNLAVCLVLAEEFERAGACLAEAQLEFTRAADGAGAADTLVVEMRLAYARGDSERALAIGQRVAEAGANRLHVADAHIVRGEIACDRNEVAAARTTAAAARAALRAAAPQGRSKLAAPPPLAAAHLAHLDGRIALLEHEPAVAGAAFDAEAARLAEAQRFLAMSDALARAGAAYRAGGDPYTAADRLFRAGRSALGRGDRETAALWAEQARDAARQAGDAPLLALCDGLVERTR